MNKKKLLHISLGQHNTEMWRSFDRHFNTTHYDWTLKQEHYHSLNADIIQLFNSLKPDVVFMQIQAPNVIDVETAKQMSKTSIVVNWTGDVRHPIPNWYATIGKHIDATLFSNMYDVEVFNKLGINANFLQVGCDENNFTSEGSKGNYPEIIFLGTNYTNLFPLSQFRKDMVQTLKHKYGNKFEVYGNGWKTITGSEYFLNSKQEAEAYRSCKIAINLSHFDYSRYSSDRMMRIMCSGAFCLSHHFKAIEHDYKLGKHLDSWKTIPELCNKIDIYLADNKNRTKIAADGCQYMRNKYTWNHFNIELKKIIGI